MQVVDLKKIPPTSLLVSEDEDDGQQASGSFDSLVRDQNKKHKKSGGFQSMGLNPNVFKGIVKKGYKQPTPIQVVARFIARTVRL